MAKSIWCCAWQLQLVHVTSTFLVVASSLKAISKIGFCWKIYGWRIKEKKEQQTKRTAGEFSRFGKCHQTTKKRLVFGVLLCFAVLVATAVVVVIFVAANLCLPGEKSSFFDLLCVFGLNYGAYTQSFVTHENETILHLVYKM